jgi:Tfp pilus assembly protein PilF
MNVDSLIKLLEKGRDDALLRFSLANAYLQASQPADAVVHLRAALTHNPGYSAAWKTLGKTLTETNDAQGAAEVYRQGVAAATDKGDMQAAKEMQVFLRRLEKSLNT